MYCGKLPGSVFIDLCKAFNMVDHAVLIQKIKMLGVFENQLNWLTDYLFNRQQVVVYDNHRSDSYPVYHGVPQGSILGLLLFFIYTDDLSKVVEHSNIIMYVDDSILYFSCKDIISMKAAMAKDMDGVALWLQINQLVINLKKKIRRNQWFLVQENALQSCKTRLCISILVVMLLNAPHRMYILV